MKKHKKCISCGRKITKKNDSNYAGYCIECADLAIEAGFQEGKHGQ